MVALLVSLHTECGPPPPSTLRARRAVRIGTESISEPLRRCPNLPSSPPPRATQISSPPPPPALPKSPVLPPLQCLSPLSVSLLR